MLLNCGVGEDSWESLGLQGDPTSHPKGDQSWMFIGGTDVEVKLQYFGHLMQKADLFEKTLMLGKLRAREEGDNRGWNGWMASPTQWTGVWVDSGIWWCTGRPVMLRFMGLQKIRHNWTEHQPRFEKVRMGERWYLRTVLYVNMSEIFSYILSLYFFSFFDLDKQMVIKDSVLQRDSKLFLCHIKW